MEKIYEYIYMYYIMFMKGLNLGAIIMEKIDEYLYIYVMILLTGCISLD